LSLKDNLIAFVVIVQFFLFFYFIFFSAKENAGKAKTAETDKALGKAKKK